MPLKADLVTISQDDVAGEWREHPLWQHLLESKSVSDPLQPGDFETLLAYTLLYRAKFKVSYDAHLSSWLVEPSISKRLEKALQHDQLDLRKILPGFWYAKKYFA